LYGISCRNFEQAAEQIPGAIGLSSSSVSRKFVEASAKKLGFMVSGSVWSMIGTKKRRPR